MAAIRQKCNHGNKWCFMDENHPKLEDLSECFPGKIEPSDIDCVVEIGGFFLFVEYKSHDEISIGQRVLYERLSMLNPKRVKIIYVVGDASKRNVWQMRTCQNGTWSSWMNCSWKSHLEFIKDQIPLMKQEEVALISKSNREARAAA